MLRRALRYLESPHAYPLRYDGSARQQMGDGGLIALFSDADTEEVVAGSDSNMQCLVVQHAPVDSACAEEVDPVAGEGACGYIETEIPADWTAADFDDSDWPAATEHSAGEVRPKDGYDQITWNASAKFVWGKDLVRIDCSESTGSVSTGTRNDAAQPIAQMASKVEERG